MNKIDFVKKLEKFNNINFKNSQHLIASYPSIINHIKTKNNNSNISLFCKKLSEKDINNLGQKSFINSNCNSNITNNSNNQNSQISNSISSNLINNGKVIDNIIINTKKFLHKSKSSLNSLDIKNNNNLHFKKDFPVTFKMFDDNTIHTSSEKKIDSNKKYFLLQSNSKKNFENDINLISKEENSSLHKNQIFNKKKYERNKDNKENLFGGINFNSFQYRSSSNFFKRYNKDDNGNSINQNNIFSSFKNSLINSLPAHRLKSKDIKFKINSPSNTINKSKLYLYERQKNLENKRNNSFNDKLSEIKNNINKLSKLCKLKYKLFYKKSGVLTQPGKNDKGLVKTNQDTFIHLLNIKGIKDFNIFGVLDGHGVNGHLVSNCVSKFISDFILNNKIISSTKSLEKIYIYFKENDFKVINNLYLNAEKQLKNENFDCSFSGTTCVIVFQIGKHLICSNSGDSRAILITSEIKDDFGDKNITDNNNNKNFGHLNHKLTKVVSLSNDMKPTIPKEMKRIEEKGGVIEKYIDLDGKKSGPYRVWVINQQYPGLAMSRSIGDFVASTVGVTCEPEIIEYEINESSLYMVICSDGIWEFLSNEKVMNFTNIYYPNVDPENICKKLIQESTNCWKKFDVVIDDITCLIVFF